MIYLNAIDLLKVICQMSDQIAEGRVVPFSEITKDMMKQDYLFYDDSIELESDEEGLKVYPIVEYIHVSDDKHKALSRLAYATEDLYYIGYTIRYFTSDIEGFEPSIGVMCYDSRSGISSLLIDKNGWSFPD